MSPAGVIGASFGVEEEFHLVDPESFALVRAPALSARALDGGAGPHVQPEMLTSQIEVATDVCASLAELRAALVSGRREAEQAASWAGATILATSSHPFASLSDIQLMDRPRYGALVERFGSLVTQFNLCGCHVHVGVPDLDTAVAIMTRARPYLPVLGALTGSSPFHEGRDTGYDSFRLAWLALWPQGGPPAVLGSAQEYTRAVDELVASGLIEDAGALLWDIRPSSRYPTLEFRVADVCTDVEDAVLFAGLVRSLVRTLGARTLDQPLSLSDSLLRAARWRAARFGLTDSLWSPRQAKLVGAHDAIEDLLQELRPDLEEHEEYEELAQLLKRLLLKGTSGDAQRRSRRRGSLVGVVRDAVALTAGRSQE
ncbi:glutamate--cysteine ligase [Jatrophihabitans telluris]|uniref:Putative glutamate--cysteine ligase 2 n=1 Tax=Jatrophihabitans telluris TaxID=2038343 RepID=A0ABY4R002_9ACTN|nr:glutamate--cysteine ligase [Jatrophihabitans telluris]UQX88456.1 glutamate--cysteine ligase [Jatrophihabitans telluris]